MPKENIAFEHFDPELELGKLDVNGRPIKPRKKPGRKPNPPSPAQRKAQNRAAQRAFRERKRREMQEAELTVKRCMHARDQALREAKKLKKRIEELEYETNYLKGYTLTLKLACVANQVEVPKFWDTGFTDEIGAEEITFSKTKGIPQQLELFLDKQLNIISIDQHPQNNAMTDSDLPPTSIVQVNTSPSSISSLTTTSFFSEHQSIMNGLQEDIQSEENEDDFILDDTLCAIAPQLANHLESPFFQDLLKTDLVDSRRTEGISTTNILSEPSLSFGFSHNESNGPVHEDNVIDAKTGLVRTVTSPTPTVVEDSHSVSSHGATNKKIFPPMTPLDAIKEMRATKNLDENTRVLFTPTELQRTIPHDTRIDVVPNAALRDHMILFQDFYNANELFDYLLENSVFLGGELGNIDAWFVPPKFFKKYWFLCPNHKHERMDNTVEVMVELNKKMIQLMAKRKQMYIERELYSEHFPAPTEEQQKDIDNEFLQRDDQQHLEDILLQKELYINEDININDFLQDDMTDINESNTNEPEQLIPIRLEPLGKDIANEARIYIY